MELVEKYLGAVRWNLPSGKTDDIVAELREVIESRIEDREEELGRPLTKGETSALLKDFGHPLIVAGRYRSDQWLIGPDIFPFYLFCLKVIVAISAAIELIEGSGRVLLSNEPLMRTLPQLGHDLWWTLLSHAGLVTLIFAIIERTGWMRGHLENWKPESLIDLPDFRDRNKSPWHHAAGVVFGIAFLLWWTGMIHLPVDMSEGRNPTVLAAGVWQAFHWPIAAVVALRVIEDLFRLVRPRWQKANILIGMVASVATIAVAVLLYRAGQWVVASPLAAEPWRAEKVAESVNQALPFGFAAVAAILAIKLLIDLWRLVRPGKG